VTRWAAQQEWQWIQWEWRADLAQAELRMTKWMVTIAIGTISIGLLIAVPALHGAAGLLFLAGTAVQMYAIAQM
jgi:hypothetical protein